MTHRFSGATTAWLTVALLTGAASASAANPTTAECLAASDASIQSGTTHKLRAERAALLLCASTSCPADIRKECASHVDEVTAELPTIVFGAKDPAGMDLSAVKVTMDGELLTERLEGTPLAVDPGEHTFAFETAGQPKVTETLVIQQAQKDRHESVTIGAARAPASHPLGAARVGAIASGGVGVVALLVGAAFGIVALSKKDDAESICPGTCSTQAGASMWHAAASAGDVSTAGLIVAGIGLAGAAALWFTAPSTPRPTVQVGLAPGALLVRGAF